MMNVRLYLYVTIVIVLNVHYSSCTTVKLEPLPESPEYKASGTKYEDGGMGPMFDFARSFINTALPGGFPADFINETISGSGTGDVLQLAQKLLNEFKGYVAAIAVGIIFIVTVPLVGACFCCCRLCGNCGGKRSQPVTDNMHCQRRIFACILFVLTVFTLVGNICTYVSNDRMSTALDKVGDIVDNNLDDIDTFLNLTVNQAKIVGIENLHTTKVAIVSKLDQDALSKEIGGFAVNQLSNGALDKLDGHIQSVVEAFRDVSAKQTIASTAYASLQASCSGSCSFLSGPLQTDPLVSNGLSSTQKTSFDNFANDNTVAKVKTQIGNEIKNKLGSTDFANLKQQVTGAFDSMDSKVIKFVTEIENFKSKAKDGMNLQSYKDKARSYTDTAKKYDQYRHTGGSVLGAIVTLIVVLQMFGLVFGSVGQGLRAAPTERGCVSNAGGNFLIASVAFIFIFSWLLMLLTTLTFSVGSILERFVCQPLSPPDFKLLKVADKQFDTTGIFKASVSQVLNDCKAGKSAYEAFHVDKRGFDINDFNKELDKQLQKIDTQMKNALTDLRTSTSLSTGNAATEAANSLDDLNNMLQGIDYNAVNTLMGQLTAIPQITPEFAQYRLAMENLGAALETLHTLSTQVADWKTDFTASLQRVTSSIGSKTEEIANGFTAEIKKIVTNYIEDAKDAIKNKIGKCDPLWNLYDSIIVVSVCKYIVDAFNGFWFSIGWCLFFLMPSLVFSVKLAKHYRTMDPDEETAGNDGEASNANGHLFKSNKVGDVPENHES